MKPAAPPIPHAAPAGAPAPADPTTADARTDAPPAQAAPASPGELFWAFTLLALQGFGGVLAVVQRELVERRRWLSHEQFVEDWAVAQVLPGPNVINISLMIGDRHFGLRGALAALAGLVSAPLVVLLTLTVLMSQFSSQPAVAGALRAMSAVAAGLIAAAGLKLLAALKQNVLTMPVAYALTALSFIAIAVFRLPLVWLLLGLGGACSVAAWWRLRGRA